MKKVTKLFVLSLAVVFILSGLAFAGFAYKVKKAHNGGDVTPSQAFEMIKKEPGHTFLVDSRTRAEYQLIGHPKGACNIPLKFWTGKFGEKKAISGFLKHKIVIKSYWYLNRAHFRLY